MHVFFKLQVGDGEVEGEQHQDRITTIAGEEKRRSHVSLGTKKSSENPDLGFNARV
jgi:hypothetical protein